eukprot:CAMPEP_0171099748 /NCGR_PEP_ID=MMETSP0766_2-20121228/52474_1 /TAXON_ID=439317 /ORGANISM="Gambierdiscus australes, Strain CAWD 149" /LENGTH=325 /DNA_ID=CAMNT_0011559451 /DNA_START=45 /DNA_END=1022 /DNA_ORIENTATION=+
MAPKPKPATSTSPQEDEDQPLTETLLDFADLGKTVDCTGFAYRSASCISKKIGSIKAIQNYQHLRSIDFSQNSIKDIAPLVGLKSIVRLNLADNSISSLKGWEVDDGEPFPYLVQLNLSGNVLSALPPLPMKFLKTVNLARNEIASCQDFPGHEQLEVMDLSEQRSNKMTSLGGVGSMPLLKKLDVSSNDLEDINGLADLPALEELSLGGNKFKELQGPWQDFPEIKSLDVSKCQLEAVKELEPLRNLPKLRTLQVHGNPFCEALEDTLRIEVLICHWRLTNLDGEPITEEEMESARQLNVEREEERLRKKAEEEAAQAAAEEGG